MNVNNNYPQELGAYPVYVESGGESALAESLEQVIEDDLINDDSAHDPGFWEPLFGTSISRHMSHQEFTVYSQGVVVCIDDTTWVFRFPPAKGEGLTYKWAGDLMGEGASMFGDETATPDGSSGESPEGTKMFYNYWHGRSVYWQDSGEGIEAHPIIYKTHHAVAKTLEHQMRAIESSPEKPEGIETDTAVAKDVSMNDIQHFLDRATSA